MLQILPPQKKNCCLHHFSSTIVQDDKDWKKKGNNLGLGGTGNDDKQKISRDLEGDLDREKNGYVNPVSLEVDDVTEFNTRL